MTISASIVFVFTTLLFLSGLFLQQQTVRQFHAALAPPKPSKLQSPSPLVSAVPTASATPLKAAYVQAVAEDEDVCAALILFSELHRSGSRHERVLLYPTEWEASDDENPLADTTRRLLREAVERYGVVLRRMELVSGRWGIWSFARYSRVLNIDLPGLLLDSRPFDEMLSTVQLDGGSIRSKGLTVLKPDASEFSQAITDPTSYKLDQESSSGQESIMTQSNITWLDSRSLPLANTATTISQATYVTIKDPSPNYQMSLNELLAHGSAPPEGEARNVWVGLYTRYAEERKRVCGLELEREDDISSGL